MAGSFFEVRMHTVHDNLTDAEFVRLIENDATIGPIVKEAIINRLTDDGRQKNAYYDEGYEDGKEQAEAAFEATRPTQCDECGAQIEYDA
jgi:hypothetical protein